MEDAFSTVRFYAKLQICFEKDILKEKVNTDMSKKAELRGAAFEELGTMRRCGRWGLVSYM